jgi:hypothetical protein
MSLFPFAAAQAQVERVNPVALSKEQLSLIQDGVRSTLKSTEPPSFGSIVGGKDGKGGLHVCGWVSTSEGLIPFSGMFAQSGFVLFRMGKEPRDADATLLLCKLRGLGL